MEVIQNETINEIFRAPVAEFAAKWQQLDWALLLKRIRENEDLFAKACESKWTYFERVKASSNLTANEFQLVTINALNIIARMNSGTATNGLVYGQVQSGKTTSMIVLASLAFDLGFKTVVLLSGRVNILRNQTQTRSQQSMRGDEAKFSSPMSKDNTPNRKRKRDSQDLIEDSNDTEEEEEYGDSPWAGLGETLINLNDSMDSDDHMYWLTVGDKDVQNVKDIDVDDLIHSTKLFAVIKKVPKSLESFYAFVNGDFALSPWKRACKSNGEIMKRKNEIMKKLAELRSGPALIIDDECDDASVASTPRQYRGIPERMIHIRKLWPKEDATNVCHYVGYSATPQANVLDDSMSEFFPNFMWEISTQNALYLGSQMYLNEELKKRIIKLIPYEDYPNLDPTNVIMPSGEKRGLVNIQSAFLEKLVEDKKKATTSMKKFLAYYVFSGAIRLQRNRPRHDLDAEVANLQGTTDPLKFFAGNEAGLNVLHADLEERLDDSNEPYHSLSPRNLRAFFTNFRTSYADMLHQPSFKQPLILAKIEELIDNRIVLYLASDTGRINTITSTTGNENPNVYILHYKSQFYQLANPLDEAPPAKPMFHSAMVHASQSQEFIALMHAVVMAAWSKVEEDIKNKLSAIRSEGYLDEVWHDLSPDDLMADAAHEIEKVLKGTHIKTAMCRGGESMTNMRTFDYTMAEGDHSSKGRPVPRFLIVVGGNMLSRGLTVEGLTVSWYTRASLTKVADTTIQHQRWFGWRHGYIDLVRVFMQERHVQVFTEAVQSEEKLRNVFRQIGLNNWQPNCRSAVLQEPTNGRLTNKGKANVEAVKIKRAFELKTPALETNASLAVLEATLHFWVDVSAALTSVRHHRAGDVVMDVPFEKVIEFLTMVDIIGMPNALDMLRQLKIYQQLCSESNREPNVNVGIPTRAKIDQEDLVEFTDANSQFIMKHRLGLHNRKRNAVVYTEFDQLLGGKSQKSAREKHQYIDAIIDDQNPLPDWVVTRDTDNADVEIPDSRGPEAPLLFLIFFLHPRFRGKGEKPYDKNAPEAGQVPLVALAGCFPKLKTRYVANKTVNNNYVYPTTDDEDPHGRQRKRAKVDTYSQTHIEDYMVTQSDEENDLIAA
jgi:hypothetical protein